jgi:hypothetical protein
MELFIQSLQFSAMSAVGKLGEFLPSLLGAVVLILIGLIVAPIVGGIVTKLINLLKVDQTVKDTGIKSILGSFSDVSLAKLFGKLVKWFVIVIFLIMAADSLGLEQVNMVLEDILFYIPSVIVAIIILTAGLLAGGFVGKFVQRAAHDTGHAAVLAKAAKSAIVVFAVIAALVELGIAPELLQILFTGVVISLALAFGLGGRKKAEEILEKIF